MSNDELRELAVMYYAVSREDETMFLPSNYEVFLSFLRLMTEEQRTCFMSRLRQRYEEIIEKSVWIGIEVLSQYLKPE